MRETTETERTYALTVPPTRSILLGLAPAEAAAAGGTLLLGAIMLQAHVPIPIAAAPAVLVLLASLRIWRGRNLFDWVPAIVAYALRSQMWHGEVMAGSMAREGDDVVLQRTPGSPFDPLPPVEEPGQDRKEAIRRRRIAQTRRAATLPPEMRGMSILDHDAHGTRVGVVQHAKRQKIYTVVAQVAAPTGFQLLPAADRVSTLAAFGTVMDGLCTEDQRIASVTWTERVVPDLGESTTAPLRGHHDERLVADYEALVDQLDAAAQTHEVFFGLSVRANNLDELDYEVAQFFGQLSGLSYHVELLSATDLHILIQSVLEGMPLSYYRSASANLAHPTAERVGWKDIQIDGMLHRAYVVQAWPRVPVGSRMMGPVLQAQTPGVSRLFTVHWQPTRPSIAQRRVRMQLARAEVERETRRRAGFLVSAKSDREVADTRRRDEEQAAGYNEHRIAGLALVSAPSRELLESGARRFEQGANRSHLEVRPLWGQQQAAWVCALPFGEVRFHTGILEF
jgi:hypothetical protein